MNKIKNELIFKLIIAVILGAIIGIFASENVIAAVGVVKYILGQFIFFVIPLIIIAFVGSSIASLKNGASKLLGFAVGVAYLSTIGAALLSVVAGYVLIPHINISTEIAGLRELPALFFELSIPPIMSVISALVLAVILGISAAWTQSQSFLTLLADFQKMILLIVNKIVLPILPLFIGSTFAELAYKGTLTRQLPVFLTVLLIVLVGHFVWLAVLYTIAGIYAKTNPREVYRHYLPAYLTAVGSMSSAATLPVALKCASKSKSQRSDMVNFAVPLFANIHLCGSVLTEVFFVMVVSAILYGTLPTLTQMLIFVFLLGIFGIGAPGVPGGTVMASLGLITGILGFDTTGTALVLTIFALQDSFGTACNVVGDGALTLALNQYASKNKI